MKVSQRVPASSTAEKSIAPPSPEKKLTKPAPSHWPRTEVKVAPLRQSELSLRNALALVEAKRALPYSPAFTYFGVLELRALTSAIIDHVGAERYQEARPQLLARLPSTYTVTLDDDVSPEKQIALDLFAMNRVHKLPEGQVPLRELLASLQAA